MLLADLGADVVKIEDPGIGDYMRGIPPLKKDLSGRYLAVNRGKRSLTLDLKKPTGKAAFLQMVAKADVVVESFRPGVMDRLGIGYETLSEINSKLIVCSISGYGQTGPYADRAGHDLNYISLAGVLAMTGEGPGRKPAMPGVQIADFAGGSLWGVASVLAALVGRHTTGRGAHLDVSMTEGALSLLVAELGNLDCGEAHPSRGTQTLNGGHACYSVYETADGKYLSIAPLEPKFWSAFNKAIGRPVDFSEIVAPRDIQERVRGEIQTILLTKGRDEWGAIFAAHDCCCEPIYELDELVGHPLHTSRDVFFHIDGGELGPILQVRTPLGTPANPTMPPRHGEHSAAVLSDYGFSEDDIRATLG